MDFYKELVEARMTGLDRMLSGRYASKGMPETPTLPKVVINVDSLIGNLIALRDGKCITYRQFYEFYNKVEAKTGSIYIIPRKYSLEDYFDDFSKKYCFLVMQSENVIFPTVDKKTLRNYFRYGLSKGVVALFDEVASSIVDTEEDITECRKACSEYSKELRLKRRIL